MKAHQFSRLRSGAVALALASLLISSLDATPQRSGRPSVYVVAVKDSAVLTMCPTPDGRVTVSPHTDDLQLLQFPPRDSPVDLRASPLLRTELSVTRAVLPIPRTADEEASLSAVAGAIELGRDIMATDPALKRDVERELARLGRHTVAESLDGADLVLLIEGTYIALASSATDAGTTGARTSGQAPPALVAFAQPGDWQRNLLQSVLAIAVPVGVYRANPGDISALVAARIWEGSEVYQPPYRVREQPPPPTPNRAREPPPPPRPMQSDTRWSWEPASPQALVWQFAGRKPGPASHPELCAASSRIFVFRDPAPGPTAAVAAGVSVGGATPATSTARDSASTPVFKSGVTYVAVPVSVTDADGRPISDLDPALFRVYEDETRQTIDRIASPGDPFNVTILVDTSSSMRFQADQTHAASVAAVKELSRVGVPVMVSFDRRIELHSALPDERDRDRQTARQPSFGRTATRFYDAVDLLLSGPLKTTPARSALVILTDGVDTASRLADAETVLRQLGESSIPAYVIQYDTSKEIAPASQGRGYDAFINGAVADIKPRLVPEGAGDSGPIYARAANFLRQIADISGGRRYVASTLDDLQKTFTDIANELSQQYTLSYYPTKQARDGTYRRIRVEVDRSDVKVRARAGYYQAPAGNISRRH